MGGVDASTVGVVDLQEKVLEAMDLEVGCLVAEVGMDLVLPRDELRGKQRRGLSAQEILDAHHVDRALAKRPCTGDNCTSCLKLEDASNSLFEMVTLGTQAIQTELAERALATWKQADEIEQDSAGGSINFSSALEIHSINASCITHAKALQQDGQAQESASADSLCSLSRSLYMASKHPCGGSNESVAPRTAWRKNGTPSRLSKFLESSK